MVLNEGEIALGGGDLTVVSLMLLDVLALVEFDVLTLVLVLTLVFVLVDSVTIGWATVDVDITKRAL
jgi:hypothetical protein